MKRINIGCAVKLRLHSNKYQSGQSIVKVTIGRYRAVPGHSEYSWILKKQYKIGHWWEMKTPVAL